MEKARELIPAEAVASEEEDPAGAVGPEQVPVALDQPRQAVRCSPNEETDLIAAAAVFDVFVEGSSASRQAVHERSKMEAAIGVHDMEARGGGEGKVPVLGRRVRRRDESCGDR